MILPVTPAKAGVSWRQAAPILAGIPAFAGVTEVR